MPFEIGLDGNVRANASGVFRKSRGGQGLGGCHFTQGGRRTVVIGGTFRRDFSSLEGAWGRLQTIFSLLTHGGTFRRDFSTLEGASVASLSPHLHFPCKHIRDWRAPNNHKESLRRPRGAWPSAPLPTPLANAFVCPAGGVFSPAVLSCRCYSLTDSAIQVSWLNRLNEQLVCASMASFAALERKHETCGHCSGFDSRFSCSSTYRKNANVPSDYL